LAGAAERTRRLEHEIVVAARRLRCKRPAEFQRQLIGRRKFQTVAHFGEYDETFQRMVLVAALLADMKKEIDLRRRQDRELHTDAGACRLFGARLYSLPPLAVESFGDQRNPDRLVLFRSSAGERCERNDSDQSPSTSIHLSHQVPIICEKRRSHYLTPRVLRRLYTKNSEYVDTGTR
jgi:hypothetical protein